MVIPTSQCLGPRNSQDSLEWKADAEPFTELCFEQQDFTQKVRILLNLASLMTNQSFGVENRDLLKRRRWGIFFFFLQNRFREESFLFRTTDFGMTEGL